MNKPGPTKPLSDLASQRGEKIAGRKDPNKPYVGLEHIKSGEPFLLGTARSDSSVSINSIFYKGDVLFGKLRPNLRKSLSAPFDGYCSTDILVLQPAAGIDADFVGCVFQRDEVFAEAVRTAEGTKMPRTSWARLRDYYVFTPECDSERRAIARILKCTDETIAKTETLIAKLRAIKQGLLHDLLTRGLDENGKLRDPEKHAEQFQESVLGLLPNGWSWAAVRELSDTYAGGTPPRSAAGMYVGTIPWVKSAEVNLREVSSTEETLTERGFYTSSTRWVEAGTPLVAMYGATAGVIGWLAIRAVTNQAVLAIPPRSSKTNARWLYWALWCKQWKLLADIQGSGQPNLSKGLVDSLFLPVPKPEEQRLLASMMDDHEARLLAEEQYCAKLKAIKIGLIHDLLSGRVLVKESQKTTLNAG